MNTIEEMRARILARANPKPLPVDIPAWGRVWVRVRTVAEVEDTKPVEGDKLRIARGVARVLCTEAGMLLFNPDSEEDVKSIASLPWVDLSNVIRVAESASSAPVDPAQGNG